MKIKEISRLLRNNLDRNPTSTEIRYYRDNGKIKTENTITKKERKLYKPNLDQIELAWAHIKANNDITSCLSSSYLDIIHIFINGGAHTKRIRKQRLADYKAKEEERHKVQIENLIASRLSTL